MSDKRIPDRAPSEPVKPENREQAAVPTSYEWFSGKVDRELLREFVRLDKEGKLER